MRGILNINMLPELCCAVANTLFILTFLALLFFV